MELTIEIERETDGRWLAYIPALRGVMVYGATRAEAVLNVQALALHVIADRMEHGEPVPDPLRIEFLAA
ncbi:MAG TPA: type II toxin-antitoxin system HicB family antitoxin [Longimicrobium sp.]|nr:type II toxin-antitoxin system HicB family antitoxin [Longimicrobium sp.]